MKVGDKVKVKNTGNTYSTYAAMAKHMGLTRWVCGEDFFDRRLPSKLRTYRIINMAMHGSENFNGKTPKHYKKTILCGIEDIDSGEQYIIGIKGLQEYPPIDEFTIEDFEI